MKWYWRKQAKKDVASQNPVKYTLHDGLMKVSESKVSEPIRPTPSVKVPRCNDNADISNLTESLESAQKASTYWRGMRLKSSFIKYADVK